MDPPFPFPVRSISTPPTGSAPRFTSMRFQRRPVLSGRVSCGQSCVCINFMPFRGIRQIEINTEAEHTTTFPTHKLLKGRVLFPQVRFAAVILVVSFWFPFANPGWSTIWACLTEIEEAFSALLRWMEILHKFETMGNRCLLVFTGESAWASERCETDGFRNHPQYLLVLGPKSRRGRKKRVLLSTGALTAGDSGGFEDHQDAEEQWEPSGCGSKLSHQGTAGFSSWFHLPGFHFGYLFLTHSHLGLNGTPKMPSLLLLASLQANENETGTCCYMSNTPQNQGLPYPIRSFTDQGPMLSGPSSASCSLLSLRLAKALRKRVEADIFSP